MLIPDPRINNDFEVYLARRKTKKKASSSEKPVQELMQPKEELKQEVNEHLN